MPNDNGAGGARRGDAVAALRRELAAVREQQAATAEVLRIISEAPTDLQRVLDAISEHACRLCGADNAATCRRDGDVYRQVASFGMDRENREFFTGMEIPVDGTTTIGRTALARAAVHIPDTLADPEISQVDAVTRFGIRSMLGVPILHNGEPIGAIALGRQRTQPYTEQQIHLVETFAAQAAIAIENARLFSELQESNAGLREALEQQTAVADVLRSISRAAFDLEPVLDTISRNAAALSRAETCIIFLRNRDQFRYAAGHGDSPDFVEFSKIFTNLVGDEAGFVPQTLRLRRTVHIPDALADPEVRRVAIVTQYGQRTLLGVPMLRDGEPVGVLTLSRLRQEPFTAQEIATVESFADQAVIAVENTRLLQELEQKGRQLEVAGRAKDEFLSRMSHELRTPMNAILGFAEILAMDPESSAKQREWAGQILGGGRHLLGLINEVLDIARIEAGQLSLSIEPVGVDAVIAEVLDLARPLAAERDIEITVEGDQDTSVQADRQRLRQVLLNLVTNGVKYNRERGEVQIRVRDEGADRIHLTVRDTGPGIAPEMQERLFVPFDRLGAELGRVEGTGLGLAIARRLAEAMGGAIGVESAPGAGSTFWVELPRAVAPASLGGAPPELAAGGPAGPEPVAIVLYIEDNPANLALVGEALRFRPGIALLTAVDGGSGLTLARARRPDLVLLDLNLPDLPGADVLARLRDSAATHAIPVVVISADATEGQRRRLLAAGAHDYLTKPLEVSRLLALLDEMFVREGTP